jgi:isoaspartyl peptidase/L-asparaginase-like protein (Ntn-hydrolase superfamily)
MSRRKFIKLSALGLGSTLLHKNIFAVNKPFNNSKLSPINKPIVISTWNHGFEANKGAWAILKNGGNSLDAVETGVRITEGDASNHSVGLGGYPDRNGKVTLDACIMNHENECGSVAFLQNIVHPISVARKVMEDTPHVMIVGQGALDFAIEKGFKKTNLLTPEVKQAWLKWKENQEQKKPEVNSENHDTIGMLAMDKNGNISGACTTSGWAYKLNGRVGDSPIIGAGLFIDNEVGGAVATGLGEAVIRIAGSHTVVELMRQGKSPQTACQLAIERIIKKHKNIKGVQVGFIAINNKGEVGGYSVYKGFNYALKDNNTEKMIDAKYKISN